MIGDGVIVRSCSLTPCFTRSFPHLLPFPGCIQEPDPDGDGQVVDDQQGVAHPSLPSLPPSPLVPPSTPSSPSTFPWQGASKNLNLMEMDKLWTMCDGVMDPCHFLTSFLAASHPSREPPFVRVLPRHKKHPPAGMKATVFSRRVWLEGADARVIKEGEEVTLMDWGNAIVQRKTMREGGEGEGGAKEGGGEGEGEVEAMEGVLHLEGSVKTTKLKLTWLADSDELVPLTLVELDYLITKKKVRWWDGVVVRWLQISWTTSSPRGEGVPVLWLRKWCGSYEKLDEGDDFLAALNPRTRWEEAAVGDANMRNLQRGDIIQLERKGLTTSFPPLRFRPPVHTLIPSSISPPFPALPFLLPFPVHPSRSPSHPPFPPIFQSPPHCPSLSPPSYSPLSSTFPFHSPIPLTTPPPLSNSPYMFPSHSPVIPPSHRQHFQVPPLPLISLSHSPPSHAPHSLQPCAGLLTNHEVFELLTDRGAMGAVDVSQGGMGPAAIECQVYTYLCAAPAATQTRAAVAKCTERAATFGLTRMETLQLIIADCEMRLPGERVEQLLQVVEETLPAAPELEGGAEEEEGG
ncbi:unnamed protein product [Closterium sp. NIES-64]|nr:unnamed protein product [Closterium sp. NIES-64]